MSLFEPETEIIRKGKAGKPTEFGKMVKLQEAENQIVIAYEVCDRRPSDSDLLLAAIETHQATLGCTPHHYSVHTSPDALRDGEAHISSIRERLVQEGRL